MLTAGGGTMAPLSPSTHMDPPPIHQGGAPGLAVISVHQGAAGVHHALVAKGKHTGGARVGPANSHTTAS